MVEGNVITPKIIQDALSYEPYRAVIDELLAQGKTTGINHSESMHLWYTRDKHATMSAEFLTLIA